MLRNRLAALWRRLRAREELDRELDDEMRSYVELLADEKVAAGLSAEAAHRAANLETGGVEQVKEAVRSVRFGVWLDDAVHDLRYGARTLARSPGFAVPALLALALGIGASAVIFAAVDAVLLKPLPYADGERLSVVLHDGRNPVAPATFGEIRAQARSFDLVGVAESWRPNLAAEDGALSVPGLRLTADTLAMTGQAPLLGRAFEREEDGGEEHVVLLGHALWQRRFAGDAQVVGRSIRLDGVPHTVVGVMPPSFAFPPFWVRDAEIWAPLPMRERLDSRGGRSLRLFARLAPGTTLEQARGEVAAIAARVEAQHPGTMRGLEVRPLREVVVGEVRPALLVLLGAVALLLLVACANVAHMQLARGARRERELALRVALGAGRGRVVRQLLVESLLLALLGAAGGLALAAAGVRALIEWRPESVPRIETLVVDARLLAVVVVASVVCALAFGLAPALQAVRRDVRGALQQGGRGGGPGQGRRRLREALVASEVALALVLLVGAGLLIRSFAALRAIDPGFDPQGVLSMVVSVRGSQESAPGRRATFFREALDRLAALPGVESAGAINHLPIGGDIWGLSYHVQGRPAPEPGEAPSAAYRVVLPGYFRTMRLPLVRGRDFDERDVVGQPGVVVVNEALAEAQWPGQDPLGRSLTLGDPEADDAAWLSVVGVARNAVRDDWSAAPAAEMYLPYLQSAQYLEGSGGPWEYLTLVVRSAGDPLEHAATARQTIASLAPDVAVSRVQSMETVVAGAISEPRLYVTLLAGFATLALLLAAVGIYGVVSYSVSQRRQEIAIRMALGARGPDVLAQVVGEGMRTVLLGAAVGVVGALALGTTLSSLLYGVGPSDPLTLGSVVLALASVALLASYVPARRAVGVRPLEALRDE